MTVSVQRPAWKYFVIPVIAFVLAVSGAFVYRGMTFASLVAFLAILEISLSFDNAIVNAKILEHWSPKWRSAFLGFGIIVAVFGMRLLFPIVIVSAATHLSPISVLSMAVHNAAQYGETLYSVRHIVSAFGGTFLLLVGLEYFLDQERDVFWLAPAERFLKASGGMTLAEAAITVSVLAIMGGALVPHAEAFGYTLSGMCGVIVFCITKSLGNFLGGDGSKIVRASIGGFIYLEVLDASFSFDGVIGAFALTNDILWIMVGLGVGALAVRELTLLAVDRKTLTEFCYLEHGAFWAILALSMMMLIEPVCDLPEFVKGLTGAALIGGAFISSLSKRT